MAKCPRCASEVKSSIKGWKYNRFDVKFFICPKCGANFREYMQAGQYKFTLMLKDGRYRKM